MTPSTIPAHSLMGHEAIGAADAAAWCLTGLLFFCLACFAWGALVLRRRGGRCSSNAPATAEERPIEPAQPAPEGEKANPWERHADWWKN